MHSPWLLRVALVVAGLSASCTSSPRACVPGQQVTCPCPGGGDGVQVCLDNGSAYGPCNACGTPSDAAMDARVDASLETGGDAPIDVAPVQDADVLASDVVQTPDADGFASDAPPGDAVDAETSPICAVTNPNCAFPPGAAGACCVGTICNPSHGTPACCVQDAHPCHLDSDCCDATEACNALGVCALAPGCRANGQLCGPSHPEVTGCCSPGAICNAAAFPQECCQPAGTGCHADADCCTNLTCGSDGLCHAPACVPTNNFVDCSLFPGLGCCDARLSCSTVSMSMPNAHCCAPSGTPLGPTDSPSICCSPGVMTLPDGSQECFGP